jgi:exosortase A-associated hydrolase 2
MPEPLFEAAYIALHPGARGSRLCLWHAPSHAPARSLFVYIHPFAEEMNKSRRMAALQARELAAAGHAVLQVDLLGCGDSTGDFSDATWAAWVDDVVAACEHAQARHASAWPAAVRPSLWLWGLRAGCLLATEAAARLDETCHLLFWQPALQGKAVLQQFLRLKTAGALLGKSSGQAAESPRQALAAGQTVDVAGYGLSPALAGGLDAAKLLPPPRAGQLEWIEIATSANGAPSPAASAALPAWTQAGWDVRQRSVAGPQFWQTTEVEVAPELIAASIQALGPDEAAHATAGDTPLRPTALAGA